MNITKKLNRKALYLSAGLSLAMTMGAADAHANTFSTIAGFISTSISSLPGLISAVAYLFGLLLGVLGILKIKDHVENPTQTPLKDGAIRLAAGGALFALPMVLDAMFNTIGAGGAAPTVAQVSTVTLGLAGA